VIAWRGLDVHAGQTALEIGAAPGGAALALARRGVNVIGVDTGAIDPAVLAYRHPGGAHVTHLPIKVGALRWEALPPAVDWLLVDVNLAPQVAIHSIARLIPPLREALRGIVFTLKLNDLRFAEELPALLGRLQQLGFRDVRARHLPSNRQEVCAVGLR
jgi:23S rRNA (cytidine2498-2'-O)-methyltransferase